MLTVAAIAAIVAYFSFVIGFDRVMFASLGVAAVMLTIRFLP